MGGGINTVLVFNPAAMSIGCTGVGIDDDIDGGGGGGCGAGVGVGIGVGVGVGPKQLLPSAFLVVDPSGQHPYMLDTHDCGNGGG
jgi:hypothetical protein